MAESRKVAAILAADVVGFSRMAGVDEDLTLARLRTLRSDLVDPAISARNGRVVKRTGDGALVEFRSVVDAVRCAIEIQSAMVERNAGVPENQRIIFRIGVHLGDVVEEADGDLMGNGVNIAARLEGIAEPGSVYLSQPAYEQVRDKLKHEFFDLGERELKNIVRPVHVYAVKIGAVSVPPALATAEPKDDAGGERRPAGSATPIGSAALIALCALLSVILVANMVWLFWPQPKVVVKPPEVSSKTDQRIFVTVSPKILISLYKDNMAFQADKLFADYVGKWVRLSGRLGNLVNLPEGDMLMTFDDNNSLQFLYMFFDPDWKDRLSTLVHDEVINTECQIAEANGYSVTFRHCRMN